MDIDLCKCVLCGVDFSGVCIMGVWLDDVDLWGVIVDLVLWWIVLLVGVCVDVD